MEPTSQHNHDSSSGLSWNETIIPAARASTLHRDDLLSHSIGRPPPLESRGPGVDSLEKTALRCLLNNLKGLEVESLRGVPERMVKMLWREICRNNLESLRLWQIFVEANPSDPPSTLHRTTKHMHPPLHTITLQRNTPDIAWLTSLTLIDKINDAPSSLPLLSSLSNLVTLHLKGDSSATKANSMINDDDLRHWGKQARHNNGFPNLRYLFLRFQPGVTEKGLRFLGDFDKLEMLVTSRCGISIREAKKEVRQYEWKMTRHAFYAHTSNLTRPQTFTTLVDDYILKNTHLFAITSSEETKTAPLSILQFGRSENNTGLLHSAQEVECWVRDDEISRRNEVERRKRVVEEEEERRERGRKRGRVREAKRRDLLVLLEGM